MGKAERLGFFDRLAAAMPHDRRTELLIEHRIAPEPFAELRRRAAVYLSASMQLASPIDHDDDALVRELVKRVPIMSNVTPAGLVKPKRETMLEFNAMQRAYADIIESLSIDDCVDTWSTTINVRLSLPEADPTVAARPYFPGKRHTDVWSSEPSDLVLLNAMIFGDVPGNTIDYFGPPDGFGDDHLVPLTDYADGERLTPGFTRYPMDLRQGGIYVSDCATLHQTRRAGGTRVSIDTTFRRPGTAEDKARAARCSTVKRLAEYIPFEAWKAIGRDALLVFRDRLGDPPKHDPLLVRLP